MSSADPVVLVTGGAQGIGAGVTRLLGEQGYRVFVLDKERPDGLPGVEFLRVDLMDADATRRALERHDVEAVFRAAL